MTYQIIQKDEHAACIDIAARAFADYEYFSAYVPDYKRRQRFLRSMIKTEFTLNSGSQIFLSAKEDGKTVAVAILCPPGYKKPSDSEYLKNGFWKTLLHGGYRNVSAWNRMEEEAIAPCRSLHDAWYLNMMVVEPDMEGKGIGSRMIGECIVPYVRVHGGSTLCLFTNSEINRRFYLKNGFEEFDRKEFTYKGRSIGSWSFRMDV